MMAAGLLQVIVGVTVRALIVVVAVTALPSRLPSNGVTVTLMLLPAPPKPGVDRLSVSVRFVVFAVVWISVPLRYQT